MAYLCSHRYGPGRILYGQKFPECDRTPYAALSWILTTEVEGDVLKPTSLGKAVSGCKSAYYLVHSMILGSGSASFEILRYLVERLPIMTTPRWVRSLNQPIAIRNVIAYLIGCLGHPETIGNTYDIGGPEILAYRDLLDIYAEEAGLSKRIIIPVPVLTPTLSALWIHLISPVPKSIQGRDR